MRLVFLALLALAACADGPPAEHGLGRLAGRPVASTYTLIGTPTRQVASGTDTVYTWDTRANGKSYVPNPTMASGFVSGLPAGMEGSANTGSSLGHEQTCEVHITANGDGKIKTWEFVGPEIACQPVARRLKAWANSGG